MKNKYKICHIKDVSINEVAELFSLVWTANNFDNILSKTQWAFLQTNSNVVLYKDGEKLIAARGAFEWPLIFNNLEIQTYQFHGTCVHPLYRRKGIFTSINQLFLEEAQKSKFDFIFNVSVDSSRAGYEKLGWVYVNGFRRLTKIHKPIRFIKKAILKKNIKSVKEIENKNSLEITIPKKFFLDRESHFNNLIHTKYSLEFLKWRLNNPQENYKTIKTKNCIIVYKTNNNINGLKELIIGDFFLLENKYTYFKKAFDLLLKTEIPDITYTYIFNTHPYYTYYLRACFFVNPFNYNLNFGTKILNNRVEKMIRTSKWGMGFLDVDTF